MAEANLYPETETDAEDAAPADNEGSEKSDSPAKESTLVAASIFPEPPEPGKVCKFKVVAVHDGEVELEYQKSDDKDNAAEMDDLEEGEMSVADSMMGKA